jgi:hypothetical protein
MIDRRAALFGALLPLAALLAGCGSSTSSAAAEPADSAGAGTSEMVMPAAGSGTCHVDVTGDVQRSWDSPQNAGSLAVSYWLSQDERGVMGLSADDIFFIMNCQSDTGSVSFTTTAGTNADNFPMKPMTYVIASGGDQPGQVSMIVNFKDDSVWRASEHGTFDVTTFGNSHFAGTFQAKLAKLGDNMQYNAGTATISGTFDLTCTSSACS